MSLQTRLDALITLIGADIKSLNNRAAYSASTAQQGAGFATDTYLAGSAITIPQGKVKAGTMYRCKFDVTKTALGIVAPQIQIRIGTAASTADTQRLFFAMATQTAAADEGTFEITGVFRAAGATASMQGITTLRHRLTTTGLNSTGAYSRVLASSGATFDVTGAGQKIGVSVNAGTSAAWTVQVVEAELINLST